VDPDDLARVAAALRIHVGDVVDAAWVDNGPGWVGVLLADADAVTALHPDWSAFDGLDIGVAGLHPPGGDVQLEVRAFCPGLGVTEDPVTGSLQAGLAQWLTATGRLTTPYVAAQGAALRRRGRVHVGERDGAVLVGGATVTTVAGSVRVGP
jgi:PhzF family phenazine biosynthesis protein